MENDKTYISVSGNVGGEMEGKSNDDDRKPITPSQRTQLQSLAGETGLPVDLDVTRGEARRRIAELEKKAGRNTPNDS